MAELPMRGGSIREGILGSPRFVNPVLAFSDTDRDLISLVYSGLMERNRDGSLSTGLAESYKVSPDNLVYTFTLKENIYFHNGDRINADDVLFTIEKIKDPIIKSPKKGNFDGISVEKIDEKTVKFTLKQPHASFLEIMRLGIIPKKIWDGSPLELNEANIYPVGSGPYRIKNVGKQSSGIIEFYEMESFDRFVFGQPFIKKINLYFYPNEEEMLDALRSGHIDQISSITPENAEALKHSGYRVESFVLPRIFGLFFNQNQNQLFTNKAVIRAINDLVNKERIVNEVLGGYGRVLEGPIPPNILSNGTGATIFGETREEIVEKAKAALAKDGWKLNGVSGVLEKTKIVNRKKTTVELAFSISTGNAPELVRSVELIREDLERVGMKIEVKTFEIGSLNQGVIRPRNYDALFFGQIINNESDLFAFWHSSQRKDPGLNVAMYTSARADKILEEAFVAIEEKTRTNKYAQFAEEIKKDMPAVFVYSPSFIYVIDKSLSGVALSHITSPADRFSDLYNWYKSTEKVWKVFAR